MAKAKVVRLSPTQVRVLQVLADNPDGLSRTQIAENVDTPSSVYLALGPVERGEFGEHDVRYGRRSLHSLGYVKVLKDEDLKGHDTYIWQITSKGEDAADKYHTRSNTDTRIPESVLIPLMSKFRHTRTYQFELYTEDDINDIRTLLPEEWRDTEENTIRQQIVNLRKTGKLSRKDIDNWPLWYINYRESEHWQEVESEFKELFCAVNRSHTGDDAGLELVHTDIDNFGSELSLDVVTLCKECRKRLKASLVKIPTDVPTRTNSV